MYVHVILRSVLIYVFFRFVATPLEAYNRTFKHFLQVEPNMRRRREAFARYLGPRDRVLSIANFPGLGTVGAFKAELHSTLTNEASRSCFVPDEVINSHARFKYTEIVAFGN
jgi:glutamate--cysteine ligase catalytic subunit